MARRRPRHEAAQTQTSTATMSAVRAALSERGWVEDRTVRLRPTSSGTDRVYVAPIIDGHDTTPGTCSPWLSDRPTSDWHSAAAWLLHDLTEAGWAPRGSGPTGTCFERPREEEREQHPARSAELAAPPPGSPARLLAIATEVGVSADRLCEAVREAAALDNHDEHSERPQEDTHTRLHSAADVLASAINGQGLAGQLVFLYQGCVSEAAFRSLLQDLHT
ncbi:hypothetical protein [Streptomyces sp. 8N706]|uniref:hypothetical protein n=1 Tax=Streptomyces sp. 8N706 TaxID=3457416 RepID=UPI003FD4FDCF